MFIVVKKQNKTQSIPRFSSGMEYHFHLNQNTFRLLVVTGSTDQRDPKTSPEFSRQEHCGPCLPGASLMSSLIPPRLIYLVPSIMPDTVLNAGKVAVKHGRHSHGRSINNKQTNNKSSMVRVSRKTTRQDEGIEGDW